MTAFASWQILDLVLKHLDLFEYIVHMLSFGWQSCSFICLPCVLMHKSSWWPHILILITFLSHSLGTFLIKSRWLTLLPWWLIRGYGLLVLRFLFNSHSLVRDVRVLFRSSRSWSVVIYGLLVCLLAFARGILHISRHSRHRVTILLKLLSLSSVMMFRVFGFWLEDRWLLLKTSLGH